MVVLGVIRRMVVLGVTRMMVLARMMVMLE